MDIVSIPSVDCLSYVEYFSHPRKEGEDNVLSQGVKMYNVGDCCTPIVEGSACWDIFLPTEPDSQAKVHEANIIGGNLSLAATGNEVEDSVMIEKADDIFPGEHGLTDNARIEKASFLYAQLGLLCMAKVSVVEEDRCKVVKEVEDKVAKELKLLKEMVSGQEAELKLEKVKTEEVSQHLEEVSKGCQWLILRHVVHRLLRNPEFCVPLGVARTVVHRQGVHHGLVSGYHSHSLQKSIQQKSGYRLDAQQWMGEAKANWYQSRNRKQGREL
ncbi:hypothetical protein L1987_16035 [Smallanthus sonchifolius]|uniref:Uncharacterized protein n=1 Tax=Smallanthus sonchifolius TaxID=185202 RepID=A0ACB9JAQ5_9ASTR|nr:hypothetical protein L1987_16035 [Smallanthus sonchifolius]